jgi:Ribonuclease G/E
MRFGGVEMIRERIIGSIARRYLRNCRTAKGIGTKMDLL